MADFMYLGLVSVFYFAVHACDAEKWFGGIAGWSRRNVLQVYRNMVRLVW